MKYKPLGIINIFIVIFLLAAIHTIFSPCQGAMEMPCNHSTQTASLILLLLLILTIGKQFVNDRKGSISLSAAIVAAGIELLWIPNLGKCQISSMSCNAKTFPTLCVGALLMIALTVISEAINLVSTRRYQNVHGK